MVWTYSGFLIQKRDDEYLIYANGEDLPHFADETGMHLDDWFFEEYPELKEEMSKDGLYQIYCGWGNGGVSEPKIYEVQWLCEIDWDAFSEEKPEKGE